MAFAYPTICEIFYTELCKSDIKYYPTVQFNQICIALESLKLGEMSQI